MPHPMLNPFQGVLRHVSIAERLSGRAQSKLMQSLDYESLARGYTISKDPASVHSGQYKAFCKDEAGTSIDIVGMAAAAGMTIYLCEHLGLSVSSAGCNSHFPDQGEYSKARAAPADLYWKRLDQSPDTAPRGHTPFRGSIYRQALSKCLQWGEDAQVEDDQTRNYPLAESYILCCCKKGSIDLVRILLKAGANTMVQVRSIDPKPIFKRGASSFWFRWLNLLQRMRLEYIKARDISGGMWLEGDDGRRVALSDIFEVTKALLVQGADVNFQMEERLSDHLPCVLERLNVGNRSFDLGLSATAMSILEECFNDEPEFQEFAVAISPLIKRPTREIVSISVAKKFRSGIEYSSRCRVMVSAADSKVLWPLFEKLKRTRHHEDLTALEMAMEQIYNANGPISDSESEDESDEEGGPESEEESEEESEKESIEEYKVE